MTDILVGRKIWKRCDSGSQISGYLASGIQIASEGYIYFRTKETQLDHVTREFRVAWNALVWP